MSIQDYIQTEKAKVKNPTKIKADIVERWNTRVVARRLHTQGKNGGNVYLNDYGKGISAPKVIQLALCAEAMNALEMASAFWEKAYELTTGNLATFSYTGDSTPNMAPIPVAKPIEISLNGIPAHLQPGKIQTMQPVDSDLPQSHFILNPDYVGQGKRDGNRDVVFSDGKQVAHQSRSTSLLNPQDLELDEAIRTVAEIETGPFVLDGERYYLSVLGSEHRTASQAAKVNIAQGKGDIQPVPVYAVFKALFAHGRDLTNATELERIQAASGIVALIHSYLPENGAKIEHLTPAITTAEKQALAAKQLAEGREGEVWTLKNCPYTGGKGHKIASIRTKYKTETDFYIKALTKTSADNRLFGAIELRDENNNEKGSCGTGFDESNMEKIVAAFTKNPQNTKVKIRHQGLTEDGKAWHAVFLDLV
jgi:hypothetical protein